jgi:hypothetical protein
MSELQEILYLGKGVILTLLQFMWESLTQHKQLTFEDLKNEKVLSALIGRNVIEVKNADKTISKGAGGTGTVRFALQATLEDKSKLNLFVKIPTGSLFERVFLTLFRVYDNEFNFYANIRPQLPDVNTGGDNSSHSDSEPKYLWCPQVYHAQ